MMLTRRFLNLLHGKLALMKRDVCALELASLCLIEGWKISDRERDGGKSFETCDLQKTNKEV